MHIHYFIKFCAISCNPLAFFINLLNQDNSFCFWSEKQTFSVRLFLWQNCNGQTRKFIVQLLPLLWQSGYFASICKKTLNCPSGSISAMWRGDNRSLKYIFCFLLCCLFSTFRGQTPLRACLTGTKGNCYNSSCCLDTLIWEMTIAFSRPCR